MKTNIGADTANRLELLKIFKIVVPRGGKREKKNRGKFCFINDAIADSKFARVIKNLIPGKTYKVNIFGNSSNEKISAHACLAFLRNQRVSLDPQGISLVWRQTVEKIPIYESALKQWLAKTS